MSVNIYGMPSGVQIPAATDFRQNQTASSRYRFRRILGEGSQAQAPFAMQTNSTTDVNFRFGAGYVINLAKTRVRISESIQSSSATLSRWVRALPPIAAIRLQTSSGVILFDIQNFDAYMNLVYPFSEKRKAMLKAPTMIQPQWADGKGANSPAPIGNTSGYPSGSGLQIPSTGPVLATGTTAAANTNNITTTCAVMEPGGPLIVAGNQAYSTVDGVTIAAVAAKQLNVGNAYTIANTTSAFIDAPLPATVHSHYSTYIKGNECFGVHNQLHAMGRSVEPTSSAHAVRCAPGFVLWHRSAAHCHVSVRIKAHV